MKKRNLKYDIGLVIILLMVICCYFINDHMASENKGINVYSEALTTYKKVEYEKAFQEFGKVPSGSSLKEFALFRQARCATNMGKKEIAVKKYKKVVSSHSKTSIVPISEYNMAILLLEMKDKTAEKHFKKIIKKYPTSDYANNSEYYLGLIEKNKTSKSEKKQKKLLQNALNHFETYLEKAPDGRFSQNVIDEMINLSLPLSNYDNLLIAKAYYSNGEYDKAKNYLYKTTKSESWAEFAKNEFKQKHYESAREYIEYGLQGFSEAVENDDVYDVIDKYIATFTSRTEGINTLYSKNYSGKGADYITYLRCNEIVEDNQKGACFTKMYEKYPNGQFSADALYNIFLKKYLQRKYFDAQRLGYLHFEKFPNTKSSAAVTYYMGRIAYKLKHYENANMYYKKVITNYPDSYYAYRAHYCLYKDDGSFPFSTIIKKPVVFPYKHSLDEDSVIKLALLKDYDLVEELCKKDKFIQSWIAYQKGNYTISAILARNAIDEMPVKPKINDLRWRLAYPLHYHEIVNKYAYNNNPLVLLAIIKEESHFNPYAKSAVNAGGLMQLMPATFAEIVKNHGLKNDIYDAENNIKAGCIYYNSLTRLLGGKDLYAISAYNGGIGSVTNWSSQIKYNDTDEFVEQIPYSETKTYVKKVLRTYWMYGNIYQ